MVRVENVEMERSFYEFTFGVCRVRFWLRLCSAPFFPLHIIAFSLDLTHTKASKESKLEIVVIWNGIE